MQIIPNTEQMQQVALAWRREGRTIALVPTMGALHAGHLALMRDARRRADRVVASIFVNPTQFGPNEDLAKYPRTFEADCVGCEAAGVDVVFAPTPDQIYLDGFQTYVTVEEIQKPLCGEFRPIHFRGVATVVLKLFNIVQPTQAIFGWKDAQQFILLCRMVKDLNVPVEMIGAETVREADGLAMSSRNKYLSAEERAVAPAIYRGLSELRKRFEAGERDAEKLRGAVREIIDPSGAFKIQYIEIVSLDALKPLAQAEPGNTLVALAAYLGNTRLIDNIRL